MKHHENCDVNDVNPEGIKKPCNCGSTPERKGKPQVGQVLFAVVEKRSGKETFNVTVESVGRKYFTCHQEDKEMSWRKFQIHLDSWRENTSWQPACLYAVCQDYDNVCERRSLLDDMRKVFDYYGGGVKDRLTLEDLRAINAIIEPKRTKAV